MNNSPIEPLVENAWYIAAWSHEVDDKPLGRRILNKRVVIFRDASGRAAVLEDRCCHRAAPLTQGLVVSEGIQCGYHGMVFDADGDCVVNPGEESSSFDLCVRSYPVVERQNFVWIWTGDPALADPAKIFDFPWHNDTDKWPFHFDVYHLKCNYMLMMDNLMDLTHLAYLHAGTIGGHANKHTEASLETTRTEEGVRLVRWMMNTPPSPTFSRAIKFKGNIDRWAEFEYVAPGSVRQWAGGLGVECNARENREQEGAFAIRLFHGVTPETDTTCHYFWSVANGYRQDDPAAGAALYRDTAATFLEDQVMLEAQQEILSEEPDRQLLPRRQDEAVMHARRAVARLQNRYQLTEAAE